MTGVEYLTLENLLIIVGRLGVQVRDPGLLASAVGRPQTTVFGKDGYPDLPSKAAALMHSLARNHALVDGNKRLAWLGVRMFLAINGFTIEATEDKAVELTVNLADGQIDEVGVLAGWLAEHMVER